MVEHKIELDSQEVRVAVDRMVQRTPKLSRQVLGELGEAIVARTNTHYLSGQVLKRKTGKLAQSVNYKHLNDWSITVGSNLAYAAIHEYGGEIYPKNGPALLFKTKAYGKERWYYLKKVTMPKRPWLSPAISDIFNTHRAQEIIDRATKRWKEKNWHD